MLTQVVMETRTRAMLLRRGCRVLDVVHLAEGMVVYYVNRKGKVTWKLYKRGK